MIKRILVLDDNQDILDIVKEALSYEKFEVKITSSSNHIIEALQRYKPDLVILDYKLNGPKKGDDICREIKADSKLCSLPVIICSAYLNTNNLSTCGCDATIAKPFGLQELLDKVNALLPQKPVKAKKQESSILPYFKKWAHIETF
jgi:DNA-binding response OmpR family regulator